VKVTIWGTRGSLASPGPETTRYGGNTSCVEVRGSDGTLLVLDAGTGIRRLGATVGPETRRVDILFSHLHLDHIEGLGFFDPLFRSDLDVHIWGPASTTRDLRERLGRYLSPPIFPVRLRDIPCNLRLHDVVRVGRFTIGPFDVQAALVCHPGPTVGYRITEGDRSIAYLPDHEPALGVEKVSVDPEWMTGFGLASGVDLLIHDAQYTDEEYAERVGWGHSALSHALEFAKATGARRLVPFHYDPSHSDEILDRHFDELRRRPLPFEIMPAQEGASFTL
jgi:phosphoribosyl 1,2-cyclic phosphodiesterase